MGNPEERLGINTKNPQRLQDNIGNYIIEAVALIYNCNYKRDDI